MSDHFENENLQPETVNPEELCQSLLTALESYKQAMAELLGAYKQAMADLNEQALAEVQEGKRQCRIGGARRGSWLVWATVWGSGWGAQVVGASSGKPGPLGGGTSVRAKLSAFGTPPLRPASGRVFPGFLPTIHRHV